MAPSDPLGWRDVAALLASTLGWEKGEEVVLASCRELGFDPRRLDVGEAKAVLDRLTTAPGIVGVTARFARSRADFTKVQQVRARSERPPPSSGDAKTTAASERRFTRAELAALLAPTIGEKKADDTITAAARAMGVTEETLTESQALSLFDTLASQDGPAAASARFARVRLMLKSKG